MEGRGRKLTSMPDSMGTSSIWNRLIMLRMRSPPKMRNMLSSRLRKNLVLPGSPCLRNMSTYSELIERNLKHASQLRCNLINLS